MCRGQMPKAHENNTRLLEIKQQCPELVDRLKELINFLPNTNNKSI